MDNPFYRNYNICGPSINLDNANSIWGINIEQFKQYNNQQRNGIFTWNITKIYFTLDRVMLHILYVFKWSEKQINYIFD